MTKQLELRSRAERRRRSDRQRHPQRGHRPLPAGPDHRGPCDPWPTGPADPRRGQRDALLPQHAGRQAGLDRDLWKSTRISAPSLKSTAPRARSRWARRAPGSARAGPGAVGGVRQRLRQASRVPPPDRPLRSRRRRQRGPRCPTPPTPWPPVLVIQAAYKSMSQGTWTRVEHWPRPAKLPLATQA